MAYILTLITVTKNCASTIERTLRSVEAIKKQDIEYIIVDGISNDGTIDIIEKYNHIIDLLVSEEDTGVYNAMNKASNLANGKYILFINGDDELIPDSFDITIEHLVKKNPSVLTCATESISVDGRSKKIIGKLWHLLFYNSIPHPSTIVKKNLILEFPFREDLRIASDYDFFLKLYLKSVPFSISNVSLSIHYAGGISSDVVLSEKEIKFVRNHNLSGYAILLDILANSRRGLRTVCQKIMGNNI